MKQEIIKAAFVRNYGEHKQKILEFCKVLELSRLGRDVQRQRFKDIENRVLSQHEFYAKQDCCKVVGIKLGERIVDADYSYLLSDDDFDRLQKLMLPIWVEEGLTDRRGHFVKNWEMIAIDVKRDFAFYIVDNVVPAEYRHEMRKAINDNLDFRDKLIDIFSKPQNK